MMTDDDKALVERMQETLREWEQKEPRYKWFADQQDYAQAAARIEALSAENERLREVLRSLIWDELTRFIIAKPDPLVEVMRDCGFIDIGTAVDDIRAALAKRGGRIIFDDM